MDKAAAKVKALVEEVRQNRRALEKKDEQIWNLEKKVAFFQDFADEWDGVKVWRHRRDEFLRWKDSEGATA